MEWPEAVGVGDSNILRKLGLRRRRDQDLSLPSAGTCAAATAANFGEGVWCSNNESFIVSPGEAMMEEAAGEQREGRRRGRSMYGPSRPAVMFLLQALLSFVGVFVVPTRLAYEILVIQPGFPVDISEHDQSRTKNGSPILAFSIPEPNTATGVSLVSPAAEPSSGIGRESTRRGSRSYHSRTQGRTGARGRRLQEDGEEEGDSYTYRARTQFHLCISRGVEISEEALRASLVDVFDIDANQIEGDAGSVELVGTEYCLDEDSNEWQIAIGNEPTDTTSAATMSAEQMETVRSSTFSDTLARSLSTDADDPVDITASDITYNSLGYLVLYDEDQLPVTTTSDGLGSNFHDVLGPDQWWPWWAWLLFGLGLLCCICPLAACIYHFRPGASEPPSPSGAGGGPGMFGKGGLGKGMGVGNVDADLAMKEYEKSGVYVDKDGAPYNDAATGVSTDSPNDYANPMSDFGGGGGGEGEVHTEINRQVQGSWPEALIESGVGVAGAKYTSHGGSSLPSQQPDESATVLSEADRAAGVDPARQQDDVDVDVTADADAAVPTPSSVQVVAPSANQQSIPSLTTDESQASVDSEADWTKSIMSAAAMGPSGRSLGDAAAAFGHDTERPLSTTGDEDDDRNEELVSNLAADSNTVSLRTEDSGVPSTMAAEEVQAERDAYEAEVAASSSLLPGSIGDGTIGGAAAGAAASVTSSLPPSGRSSGSNSRSASIDPAAGGIRLPSMRSRATSSGSTDFRDELRQLTDEERQQRMEESDAARAASLLRGSSFRVPLQPDLERAITVEEQTRRREAVQKVEAGLIPAGAVPAASPPPTIQGEASVPSAAVPLGEIGPSPAGMSAASPPSTSASVASKVLMSVGHFFGIAQDDAVKSPTAGSDGAAAAAAAAAAAPVSGAARGAEEMQPRDVGVGAAVAAGAVGAAVAGAGAGAAAIGDDQRSVEAFGASGVDQLEHPVSREGRAAGLAPASTEASLRGRSLSPEEAQAYSDNVDRTLEELPVGDAGGATMPMSELLARAELEAQSEPAQFASPQAAPPTPVSAAIPSGAAALPTDAAARALGLPPAGPGQAAALALQQQSAAAAAAAAAGTNTPALDLARLIHNAEEGGMTLEELEASLASPIVATPPALLRPGVGAAARGAAARGRHLLHNRPSVSGSFLSSRSASMTEEMMSNNALTEDDMSSDAQTTDVSRTSSYLAAGSSFEESLAQAQAASGHFLNPHVGGGAVGGGGLSSLAERLARAEETVGRDYEKGMLYHRGAEGVAAVVAGETLPAAGARASVARGAGVGVGVSGEETVESLADMLARADDGGNLKETFRLLDDMEAKRLEDLNAAASADGADDEAKARWRGSLAELMVKVDRAGNLREVLDIPSEGESGASEGQMGQPSATSDSTNGSTAQWGGQSEVRPE